MPGPLRKRYFVCSSKRSEVRACQNLSVQITIPFIDSSMESEPKNSRRDGNQNRSLRWSHPFIELLIGTIRKRVLESVVILDSHGFRAKASELQRLLQLIPFALSAGGQTPIKTPESKGAELKRYR
jgi:hypothetical protein